jgi:hypothetical protein
MPLRLAVVAAVAMIVGVGAVSAATHWPGRTPHPASSRAGMIGREVAIQASEQVAALSRSTQLSGVRLGRAAKPGAKKSRTQGPPQHAAAQKPATKHNPAAPAPTPPVYLNPLRSVSGLIPERIDMGVDFGGSGPVYALGDAVITNATADSPGWPGGGWITYQLTDGPAAGLQVYVAEDVTPTVQVGEHVTSSTVIANMFNGGDGIETGWAMPDGASAESQLPVAGAIGGAGPFPTRVGLNFEQLLQALGVVAALNAGQPGYGLLPPNYPTDWTGLSSGK